MIPQVEFLVAFYELATNQNKAKEVLADGKRVLANLKAYVEAKTTLDSLEQYTRQEHAKLDDKKADLDKYQASIKEQTEALAEKQTRVMQDLATKSAQVTETQRKVDSLLVEVESNNTKLKEALVDAALKTSQLEVKEKDLRDRELAIEYKQQKFKELLG